MNAVEKFFMRCSLGYHVCVGLDTDIAKIPRHLLSSGSLDPIFDFNKAIVEATRDITNAYKINLAFYEAEGIEGLISMKKTIDFIQEVAPNCLIIGDAKRGDIGNTSKKYAEAIFNKFGFDSITVNPYMGYDSVAPFLDFRDKLTFILALTSNIGSNDIQKLELKSGSCVFNKTLELINKWNVNSNAGIVFGATNIEELKINMSSFLNFPILIPGVGEQGGSAKDVATIFKFAGNHNYLVNSSRGIIYKNANEHFADFARTEVDFLNTQLS